MATVIVTFEVDGDQRAAEAAAGRQIARDMLAYAAKHSTIVSCHADYKES